MLEGDEDKLGSQELTSPKSGVATDSFGGLGQVTSLVCASGATV